jgi:alpha-D-ribose 1-methylphosphonate 5-triphosphate synthase subunit PhnH
MSDTIALPGFADPVGEAQATFRAVLDAMASPGRLHTVAEQLTAPAPLDPATAAVLLTLVDNETPLWPDAAARPARDWLAFHCGAAVIEAPDKAAFAVALSLPDLATLPAGTHEAPEDSATLILQIAALGTGARYRLSGPGLREPAVLAASGLPADFAAAWQRNHAQYPCGIDVILCSGATLAALPRSVSIEEI